VGSDLSNKEDGFISRRGIYFWEGSPEAFMCVVPSSLLVLVGRHEHMQGEHLFISFIFSSVALFSEPEHDRRVRSQDVAGEKKSACSPTRPEASVNEGDGMESRRGGGVWYMGGW
jgi:hypothetical protein